MRMEGDAEPPLVVFVCEHGSAKSLVAASFFERLAKERGIRARAVSRGTSPDAAVPAGVVAALRDDGFDVAPFQPRRLSEADLREAACVVAIGVELGEAGAHCERWDDLPAVSVSYAHARDVIVSRIESLLRRL